MTGTTRILVIRFSSIGDIVLCSSVIRALKTQLEGPVEIDFITKRPYASLVETNPHIHHVITIDTHVREVAEELQTGMYDYVIDMHHNLRSWQVRRAIKALTFSIDKKNLAKWIYVNTKRKVLPIGHFVERTIASVQPLGIGDDGRGLDFYIPDSAEVSHNVLPEQFRKEYITYAIGGKMPGKILPEKMIIQMLKLIHMPVVMLGGPEDAERGERIAKTCGSNVWNACGRFSILQSASLIKGSKVLLSHDTGLMHIGAALKKQIISIWLATTPEIGMSPWRPGPGSVMVEAVCKKRPTSKLGDRGYQDGCVFNIDLQMIASLVNASPL